MSQRYRKWKKWRPLPNSFVLSGNEKALGWELDTIFNTLGGAIAIAQAERKEQRGFVAAAAQEFYDRFGTKRPRLMVFDEVADFYEKRLQGDIIQLAARNGGEKDIALIGESQRTRKVPVELMSEMTRAYIFKLGFEEDEEHIRDFGIPDVQLPSKLLQFYLWDRFLEYEYPSHRVYELNL